MKRAWGSRSGQNETPCLPPNKRMQATRASALWYGRSMLTLVNKVPLISRGDAREPDACR